MKKRWNKNKYFKKYGEWENRTKGKPVKEWTVKDLITFQKIMIYLAENNVDCVINKANCDLEALEEIVENAEMFSKSNFFPY